MILKSNDKNNLDFIQNFNLFYKESNKINLNNLKNSFNKIAKLYLKSKDYFLIIREFEKNRNKLEKKIKLFEKFTTLLEQNEKGIKIVKVSPKRSLLSKFKNKEKKNLRYHQTNLGGSIHSDGPQLNKPPKYIIMACSEQAKSGGYSIIAYANKIYENLKVKNKKILKILKQKFIFERRGFKSIQETFAKPIFISKKNYLSFRYLRDYIDSGYKIKNQRINKSQLLALKKLDQMLSKKKYQKRYKLNRGDIILLNNNILAHGRTKFKVTKEKNRSLLRAWIK